MYILWFGFDFWVNRKVIGLWSINRTVGCFDPSIKNSYSVRVYSIVVHSLISVKSLSSACVNFLEFAEIRFTLFIPLRDCYNAAPKPKIMPKREVFFLEFINWNRSCGFRDGVKVVLLDKLIISVCVSLFCA